MKRFLCLLLVSILLLCACSGQREMIGEEKAIEIAFEEAVKYADGPIKLEMGVCDMVQGRSTAHDGVCYEVTFDGETEETLGFSVIVTVILDAYSGEILEVMEAV